MVRLKKIIYSFLIASTTLALFQSKPIYAQELLVDKPIQEIVALPNPTSLSTVASKEDANKPTDLGLGDLVDYAKYKLFADIDLAKYSDFLSANSQAQANNQLILSEPGLYRLTGNLTNQSLIVDVADTESIGLIMQQVTLENASQPSIHIKHAKAVDLFIPENSYLQINQQQAFQTLTSSSIFTQPEAKSANSAIEAQVPLTIYNQGLFSLTSDFSKGIDTTEKLTLIGGTYQINTLQSALISQQAIDIQQANLQIYTTQNALVAMAEDESGDLCINQSSVDLNYGQSAMQIGKNFSLKDSQLATKLMNAAIQPENTTGPSTLAENDEDSNYFTISSEMSI